MINRNIGKNERIARFMLAVLLLGWVLAGDSFGPLQLGALIAAFALLWNSIFGRCYLWKWFGLSSCNPKEEDCNPDNNSAAGGYKA